MKLYKFLNENGTCYNGGKGKWELPRDGKEGKWMTPIRSKLIACQNGYHFCRESDLLEWIGPSLYEADIRGKVLESENKIVVSEARLIRKIEGWNRKSMIEFACCCAIHVLPFFENLFPDDSRPRGAVIAARAAAGEAGSAGEAKAAAGEAEEAAWAAWAAGSAGAAAGAAAWAAGAAAGETKAAWAAARAAAWAAGSAAGVAWEAERKWQLNQFKGIVGIS